MVINISAFRDVTNGEVLLASVGGIDATADTTTSLYTVPTGQTVVITKVVLRVEAISALTVDPVIGVEIVATSNDVFYPQTVEGLTAAGDTWTFGAVAKAVQADAGDTVNLDIGTLATATTLTLSADVFGYYIGSQDPVAPPTWVSFTPTGSWSGVTYTGMYRKYSDEVQVRVRITMAGAPTGGNLTLNPVSGLTPDNTKHLSVVEAPVSGKVAMLDSGIALYAGFMVMVSGATFEPRYPTTGLRISGGGTDNVNLTKPFTWGSGDEFYVEFSYSVA